jgi:hypothetical protein
VKLKESNSQQYHQFIDPAFKPGSLNIKISATQQVSGNNEIANYINGLKIKLVLRLSFGSLFLYQYSKHFKKKV